MTPHSACNVEQVCKDLAVVSHAKVADLLVVAADIPLGNRIRIWE